MGVNDYYDYNEDYGTSTTSNGFKHSASASAFKLTEHHSHIDASSILVAMKNDGTSSHPNTPPQIQALEQAPPTTSTILQSLKQEDNHNEDTASAHPLSPSPNTSSILMSLKNDTSHHVLNSSDSSYYSSSSPSHSRSPSPSLSSPPQSPSLSFSTISPPSSPIAPSARASSSINTMRVSSPTLIRISSAVHASSTPGSKCFVPNCLLCANGTPSYVLKTPTWSSIMRVVFYSLHLGFPEKLFFNLRADVYVFMTSHWDKLCPSKDVGHHWKKQIQDMLSHSKNMFESGIHHYKQNGYWRLRQPLLDPWTVVKPFHHRIHKSSRARMGQFGVSSPSNKIDKYFDYQVPALSENKSLVHAFIDLKCEMSSMREQVKLMLSSSDRTSYSRPNRAYSRSYEPYKWEPRAKKDNQTWDNQYALFNNNVLPPFQSCAFDPLNSPFSQPLRFRQLC